MSSPADPPPQPRLSPDGAQEAFGRALRFLLWLLGGLLLIGSIVGFVLAGADGVWSALIGTALALVFSGTTVLSVMRTHGQDPGRMVMVIMGAWLVKVLIVFVALAVLSRASFIDRSVLAVVLLIGVIGSALLDYRAVSGARMTYVDDRQDESHLQGSAPEGDQ